jgi:hypothetical protein
VSAIPKWSKPELAWRLRRLASRIWNHWELGEVRYLSEADLIVIQIVGKIDGLANRLDKPW